MIALKKLMKGLEMKENNGVVVAAISSFWKLFRMIFVVFSLYVTGIMFYSWDGFRYYGLFSDFLSGIALVLIFWNILAVILAILIFFSFKVVEWCSLPMGWKIRIEHVMMVMGILLILGFPWNSSLLIFKYLILPQRIQSIIIAGIPILSICLAILFRNRAISYSNIIQERITPLVWLFGVLAIFSVALVAYKIVGYQVWGKKYNAPSSEISQVSFNKENKPNIILVTFDAMTTWNMSTYGYLYGNYRETTPFISDWAKNTSIFTMAEASSNYTVPTTASLMTGKRVWTHSLYNAYGYNKNADTENLPLLLKNNGYYNIALIQNPILSVGTLGISNSFDIAIPVEEFMEPKSIIGVTTVRLFQLFGSNYRHYNNLIQSAFLGQIFYNKIPIKVTSTEYPPEKVFNRFLKKIENTHPEPFFAWLHVFPPHDPYLPPDPFMGMFDSSPKLRTEKSQWLSVDFDTARARYDEYIRYCDKVFENFIKGLTGHIKNTVIILSADHGHSFAHNYRGHGGPHLYEQLTNIPLIIMEPDQTQGRIIDDVVEQIDIAPTILELAGIQHVPSWMEGRSLVPLVNGKERPLKPALSMYLEKNPKLQKITQGTFAVWEGDYKLIHYLKENKSLLFNLKQDPSELNNLVNLEPEIAERLLTHIKTSLKEANKKIRIVQ